MYPEDFEDVKASKRKPAGRLALATLLVALAAAMVLLFAG